MENQPDHPLEPLHTLEGYRQFFMDVDYWQPYVRMVCQQQGFSGCHVIRAGLAGTYPTFIIDDRWVVKFFGRLFDGEQAFETERQVNQILTAGRVIPAPALMGGGHLFKAPTDWGWPYLIFEFIPGISIGEIYEKVSFGDKLRLARQMSEITRRLHQLPIADGIIFKYAWQTYRDFLEKQYSDCPKRHQAWQTLPPHLLEQIDPFLLPLDDLIKAEGAPHLIHADLTADHILGQLTEDGWTTAGIIDFGDAMIGSLGYELVALHLDLFRFDKQVLAAYLDAYGLESQLRQSLPAIAMNFTLLHRFNVLAGVFERYPHIGQLSSLAQLAALLWDIETPGLNDEP